jgi:hypothetical protein
MLMMKKFSSPELVMTVGSYRRMVSLAKARQEGTGFPRVSPEHKLRFSFDRNNNVVASSFLPRSQRSVPRWAGADVWAAHERHRRDASPLFFSSLRVVSPISRRHSHLCIAAAPNVEQVPAVREAEVDKLYDASDMKFLLFKVRVCLYAP